jgi:hypothetical protein
MLGVARSARSSTTGLSLASISWSLGRSLAVMRFCASLKAKLRNQMEPHTRRSPTVNRQPETTHATTANYIPPSISADLPSMVRNELTRLSAQKQEEFIEEYRRNCKSIGMAYVCWCLLGVQYAYHRKWGLQALYWLTGWGFMIWAVIDLFRIPSMTKSYNKDVAVDVLRNLKAIN